MPTLNYSFEELWGERGEGTSSISLTAGTTYNFLITSSIGAGYLTLETVRNYDGVTPKNTSGSYTALTNIASSVISDYIAGFSVPRGFSSFVYTPASNVVGSTLKLRGVGGVILGSGATPPTPITASFRIDTTQTSGTATPDDQFLLPLGGGTSPNFTINWGDGTSDVITSNTQPEILHTYTSPGEYFIEITSGVITNWRFQGAGDAVKLMEIYDWSKWNINVAGAFDGCTNLVSSATSVPTISSTSLSSIFRNCYLFNGPINGWDVSGVTDMNNMFYAASSFNQPLNSWVVSNVADMSYMFGEALAFNQPLDSWDVSSVTNMNGMFFSAIAFNQPLNSWVVSNVDDMSAMFNIALSFNQPLDNWDVSSVTNMNGMFFGNLMTFNQNIGSWDISNVTDFGTFLDNALPTSFSPSNLDAIYNGWSLLTVQPNVTVSFGVAKYTSAGAAGRAILDNAPNNWIITDGGQV
jgi:surface protein